MEYLTKEWLIEWANKHCSNNPTKEEREKAFEDARIEAEKILSKLDKMEITFEPIIFDMRDFPTNLSFNVAMDIVGKRYKNVEGIKVEYAKPENKKKKEVYIQFLIRKEKIKNNERK